MFSSAHFARANTRAFDVNLLESTRSKFRSKSFVVNFVLTRASAPSDVKTASVVASLRKLTDATSSRCAGRKARRNLG